jgi:hypothetical protein
MYLPSLFRRALSQYAAARTPPALSSTGMIDNVRNRQPPPRRTMSLVEELRVRTARLAELEQRERDRQADPARLAETEFWSHVDRLLGNPVRAREDQEEMKSFEAWGTRTLGFAYDSLADWLDE